MNYPVVTHEKHRIKLEDIQKTRYDDSRGELFKYLMSSINPFSKYILEEVKTVEEVKSAEKAWVLDQSIF